MRRLSGNCIAIAATLILLSGCTLISGSHPIAVTASDRVLLGKAEEDLKFNIPLLTQKINNKHIEIYKVAFDGTMNDVARVPPDERISVVGLIDRRIESVHYYPGPGMQNPHFRNWLDGLLGYTSSEIAERAEKDFFKQANDWLSTDPNTDIRVFVTGFSRGSAIARHFMNIVERDWPTNNDREASRGNEPHFYALLFDSVSTGQIDTLSLPLPSLLDYAIHVVAIDEPRRFYRPVIDRDAANSSNFTLWDSEHALAVDRIKLILLPGAHSDIGGSYQNGVGDIYRDISEQILHKMGLLSQNCWEHDDDPLLRGKHDSRGDLDVVTGASAPNTDKSTERLGHPIAPESLSEKRRAEITSRLFALEYHEQGMGITSITRETPNLSLTLRREGEDIKVVAFEPVGFLDESSFKFSNANGRRFLTYRYLSAPANTESPRLEITNKILAHLQQGRNANLSYSILDVNGELTLTTLIDNIEVDSSHAKIGPTIQFQTANFKCKRDAEKNATSPIKILILRAPSVE